MRYYHCSDTGVIDDIIIHDGVGAVPSGYVLSENNERIGWVRQEGGSFSPPELNDNLEQAAREERDLAINSIAYNLDTSTTVDVRGLTDVAGRIVQARPQDEQNIRNGMRAIELSGATSINWVMLDNTKQAVTSAELQTVLDAGILRGLQVWDEYDPT
jgi:hypothetical protein